VLMGCLDGLSEAEVRWRPPVPEANSLLVLALHTVGSTEAGILQMVCGQPVDRVREQEFVEGERTVAGGQARWQTPRPRLSEGLATVPPAVLDELRTRPERPGWGTRTVREALLITARHVGEHMGQAELTRDWVLAQRLAVSP